MNVRNRETLLRAARIGLAIVIVFSLFAAAPVNPVKAESRIIVVGPGMEFPNIMNALKWAGPDSVIYVKAGTYYDQIDLSLMGQFAGGTGNLAIISIDGPGKAEISRHNDAALIDSSAFYGSVWLDGVKISSGGSSAIDLDNFQNLLMTNCIIDRSGDTALDNTDAINLNVASGNRTVALYKTTVSNFVRDGLNVLVSGTGQANVVVEGSTFKADSSEYQPQKAIDVMAVDSAKVQLTVATSAISGMWNAGISATADSASPVSLSVHVFNNDLVNVAQASGANAVEVRSRGGGAHTTVARVIANNPISIPVDSNGIYFEPASGAAFYGVVTNNYVTAGARTITTPGRGIVIDNTNGGLSTPSAAFTINDNAVTGTASSGISVTMRNTNATWYNLVQNNNLSNVNSGIGMPPGTVMPANEGMVFRLQSSGVIPWYIMHFTGNYVQYGRNIKLDNSSGSALYIVGSSGSASDIIHRENPTIYPYMMGGIGVTSAFSAPNIQNQQPIARHDELGLWMNAVRSFDVMFNDTDDGAKLLVFANPLGINGGQFSINTNETPDLQMDDMLMYQPQPMYQGEDFNYYVMQDSQGWSSIGTVHTTIYEHAIFMPFTNR